MAAETTRNSVWYEMDYNNKDDWLFNTTYMTYLSQKAFIDGLFIDSYFGDAYGGNKGISRFNILNSLF